MQVARSQTQATSVANTITMELEKSGARRLLVKQIPPPKSVYNKD